MYYPPVWGGMAVIAFALTIAVAVPAARIEATSLWLGIAIPVASVLYGTCFYALCWRHLVRVDESFITNMKPAVCAPTKEVRRMEKATFMLLTEMERLRIDQLAAARSLARNRKPAPAGDATVAAAMTAAVAQQPDELSPAAPANEDAASPSPKRVNARRSTSNIAINLD